MMTDFEAQFMHGAPLMIDHTPGAAVAAGEVLIVGTETRIAHLDIAANELGAVAAPSGSAVYKVKKASGQGVTFADGAEVQWDATNNLAVAVGDAKLGVAVAAAADADDYVWVRHEV